MARLLGSRWLSASDEKVALFSRDQSKQFGREPVGVARPSSTDEVAAVVAICAEHGVSISPQGGNTSVNGGSVLGAADHGIILSLGRMNRIHAIDPINLTVTAEAGVVLTVLHEALAGEGLAFPLHSSAEDTAQLGGMIGTNAADNHAARHGMMQDLLLGLEVVLPDGRIWNGARALSADNAGYQLRRLFCGAEGTLGIVTRAVLRVFPAPAVRATALLALADLTAAEKVAILLRSGAGEFLTALEFFCEGGLALAVERIDGLTRPLPRGKVYLLVELATSVEGIALADILDDILSTSVNDGVIQDALIGRDDRQCAALWRLCEAIPAAQLLEGRQLRHDVAVPFARMPAFVVDAIAEINAVLPGTRVYPFGHLGEGNVQFNLLPPPGSAGFLGKELPLSEAVYRTAMHHHGTISAEYGLGQAKAALADRYQSPVERELMRRIKAALDPHDIMNPGKVVGRRQ